MADFKEGDWVMHQYISGPAMVIITKLDDGKYVCRYRLNGGFQSGEFWAHELKDAVPQDEPHFHPGAWVQQRFFPDSPLLQVIEATKIDNDVKYNCRYMVAGVFYNSVFTKKELAKIADDENYLKNKPEIGSVTYIKRR